jgi:hypothetical protein
MMKKQLFPFLLLLTLIWAENARSYTLNARTMGMGGVNMFGEKRTALNPAYRAVPKAKKKQPLVIPIPLGLFKFLGDMPEFDPDKPDFDAVEIANLIFNPPLDLELIDPPTTGQSNVVVDIGINELSIDLGKAGEVIPEDEIKFGGSLNADLVSMNLGEMFFTFSPLFYGTSKTTLSDNLIHALRDAARFTGDETYTVTTEGTIGAGVAFGLGQSKKIYSFTDVPVKSRDGVYAGFRGKYMIGLAYMNFESAVDFITGDPLFAALNPMTTRMNGILRTSVPGTDESGSTGTGVGLDLGMAVVRGPWEFGIGFLDMASTIKWSVHEEVYRYDEDTNDFDVIEEKIKKSHSERLPRIMVANFSYHAANYRLGGEFRKETLGVTTHLGVEYDLLPKSMVLRGGMMTDTNKTFQVTGGMGLRLGRIGFDFALATNNDNLSRERGLSFYTSLAIY